MPITMRFTFIKNAIIRLTEIVMLDDAGQVFEPEQSIQSDSEVAQRNRFIDSFRVEDFSVKFYYENFRKEIEREDNLTHQRLTWLMTFQGFLIAATGIIMAQAWPSDHGGIVILRKLTLGAFGVIGCGLAVISYDGVKAARKSMDAAIREWDFINEQLKIIPSIAPQAHGSAAPHRSAYNFALSIPKALVRMWLLYLFFYTVIGIFSLLKSWRIF